jgi:hypothetical protein
MTVSSMRPDAAEEMRRPYAPASHVTATLRRARSRNLPERITVDFLGLAGVPAAIAKRTTFALRFLSLTEEDGSPTGSLRAISASGESEYQALLANVVRNAYAADFERIDPAADSQKVIVDAFARYSPRSQTDRMVMLFLGLCREAGIPVLEAPRKRALQPANRTERSAPNRTSRPPARATSSQAHRASTQAAPADGVPLFSVTDADIAVLDEEEFVEIWAALGKIARARARARHADAVSESAVSPVSSDEEE